MDISAKVTDTMQIMWMAQVANPLLEIIFQEHLTDIPKTVLMFCGFSHNQIWMRVKNDYLRRIWLYQGQPNKNPTWRILHLILIWRMEKILGQVPAMRPQFLKWAGDPGIPVYWHTRPVITKAS